MGTNASVKSRFSLGCNEWVAASGDPRVRTVMYARGGVGDPKSLEEQWVVPRCVENTWCIKVGSVRDTGAAHNGVASLVWEKHMEVSDEECMMDGDTNKRVLVYDVVILGSTLVFDGAEWDILYHHLLRFVMGQYNP